MFSLYLGTYQHSVDVSSVLLLLLLLQTLEATSYLMAKQSQHMLSVSALKEWSACLRSLGWWGFLAFLDPLPSLIPASGPSPSG